MWNSYIAISQCIHCILTNVIETWFKIINFKGRTSIRANDLSLSSLSEENILRTPQQTCTYMTKSMASASRGGPLFSK